MCQNDLINLQYSWNLHNKFSSKEQEKNFFSCFCFSFPKNKEKVKILGYNTSWVKISINSRIFLQFLIKYFHETFNIWIPPFDMRSMTSFLTLYFESNRMNNFPSFSYIVAVFLISYRGDNNMMRKFLIEFRKNSHQFSNQNFVQNLEKISHNVVFPSFLLFVRDKVENVYCCCFGSKHSR